MPSPGYHVSMHWSYWVGMNKGQSDGFGRSEVEPAVRIVCLMSKALSVYPILRLEGCLGSAVMFQTPRLKNHAN